MSVIIRENRKTGEKALIGHKGMLEAGVGNPPIIDLWDYRSIKPVVEGFLKDIVYFSPVIGNLKIVFQHIEGLFCQRVIKKEVINCHNSGGSVVPMVRKSLDYYPPEEVAKNFKVQVQGKRYQITEENINALESKIGKIDLVKSLMNKVFTNRDVLKKKLEELGFIEAEIEQILTCAHKAQNIKVNLKIPQTDIQVDKHYSSDQIVNNFMQPVGIFPRYISQDWQYYEIMFDEFKRAFGKGAADIVIDVISNGKVKRLDSPDVTCYLSLGLPEAIVFRDKNTNEELGYVLPAFSVVPISPIPLRIGALAFDFGTSNTFWSYLIDGKIVDFITTKTPVLRTFKEESSAKEIYSLNFRPTTELTNSYQTICRKLRQIPKSDNPLENVIVIGHEDATEWSNTHYHFYKDSIIQNPKWSGNCGKEDIDTDEEDNDLGIGDNHIYVILIDMLFKAFTQLKFEKGVYAIDKMIFSVPDSMSPGKLKKLKRVMEAAVDYLNTLKDYTNISVEVNEEGEPNICFISEGVATLKYILSQGKKIVAPSDAVLLIDIGGGSSDYALFINKSLKMLSSVELAGNSLCQYFISHKKAFQKLLEMLNIDKTRAEFYLEAFIDNPYAIHNSVIKNYYDELCRKLDGGQTQLKEYPKLVRFLLSALIYYGALCLKKFIQPIENERDPQDVAIVLTGNGAKLARLLGKTTDSITILEKVLQDVLPEAKSVKLRIIPEKKAVACGSLIKSVKLEEDSEAIDFDRYEDKVLFPAGEEGYIVDGQNLAVTDTFISTGISKKNVKLPGQYKELGNFCKRFKIDVNNPTVKTEIDTHMNTAIQEFIDHNKSGSLFIEECKAVMAHIFDIPQLGEEY